MRGFGLPRTGDPQTTAEQLYVQQNVVVRGTKSKGPVESATMIALFSFFAILHLANLGRGLPNQEPSLLCSSDIYGQPDLHDSTALTNELPYVKYDPDNEMKANRIFAEPAVLQPRFKALKNLYKAQMVQLPMIWRYRKHTVNYQNFSRRLASWLLMICFRNTRISPLSITHVRR